MIPEEEITIKINKKSWKIKIVKSTELSPTTCGECDNPSRAKPEIWVKRSLKPKDLMDTVIHEVIHAIRPERPFPILRPSHASEPVEHR